MNDRYDILIADPYDDPYDFSIIEGCRDLSFGEVLREIVKLSSGDWEILVCKTGTIHPVVRATSVSPNFAHESSKLFLH